MDTQQENPRRSDIIRCPLCGEDYSTTYRRCPFCEGMVGHTTARAKARQKSGKRKSSSKSIPLPPIAPVRIIGYVLGLILIIAAIYIICSMLAPLFGGNAPATSSSSSVSESVSLSQPEASASVSAPEVSTTEPAVSTSTPDVSTTEPVVVDPTIKTTGITLNRTDFTLKADESHKITATVTPADSEEAVTWTSSDPAVAHVAADGTVTNVNTGNGTKAVTITATSGSVTAQCTVRCKPGSTGNIPAPSTPADPGTTTPTEPTPTEPTPATPAPSAPAANTTLPAGTVGTITSAGVRIRSGPGSSYAPQASATKGAKVTVLEKTSDGWYKIEYIGNGGTATGYISADYVSVD